MAQSNLVHLMREEKTSRGLAELMKELVLASGAQMKQGKLYENR